MRTQFLTLLFICACASSYAQRGNYASSIGLSAGYAEDGIGFMATYNYHLDRFAYFQVSVFASIAEDKGKYDIPYNIFTVQPGYFRRIWEQSSFQNFAINIGGGGVIGYEVINNGNNEIYNGAVVNAKSQFIYGVYLGIEGEIRVGNDLYILIKGNEYYHINSDVGKIYPYVGLGFRYFLF